MSHSGERGLPRFGFWFLSKFGYNSLSTLTRKNPLTNSDCNSALASEVCKSKMSRETWWDDLPKRRAHSLCKIIVWFLNCNVTISECTAISSVDCGVTIPANHMRGVKPFLRPNQASIKLFLPRHFRHFDLLWFTLAYINLFWFDNNLLTWLTVCHQVLCNTFCYSIRSFQRQHL